MTVGAAVGERPLVRGIASGTALRERVASLLIEVGLRRSTRRATRISFRRREPAHRHRRALALRPALLVCDETGWTT